MLIYILIGFLLGGTLSILVYALSAKNQKILEKELENTKNEKSSIEINFSYAKDEISRLKADNKALEVEIAKTKEASDMQKSEFLAMKDEMNKEFHLLANNIFEKKTLQLSQINEEKIGYILNPLKENISRFEKKVEETYSQETREKASLKAQIEMIVSQNKQISQDAQRLTSALKGDKKLQGNWGEIQLEQILQYSGLQEGVHYNKQVFSKNENGERQIPDYIINLPEDKHYVIDSKVSLVSYAQYFASETEEEKVRIERVIVSDIKKHIDTLSKKNYHNIFAQSPDFVFMFVAIEPVLLIAMNADKDLFQYAFSRNIILVSNTTLLATLKTVSFVWTQENQRKNVMEIAETGGKLYDKFVGFIENLIKVGKGMDASKEIYESAMNQLFKTNSDGQYTANTIIGMTEKLKKLGAKASKQIPQQLIDRATNE